MKVVKDRRIVDDSWHLVADGEAADANAIVSLERWNSESEALLASAAPIGVVLRSHQSPDDLNGLNRLALIAVDFPAFTDGRAVGDVMRDEMFLMSRCGIDSFAVKPGKDIEKALSAFDDFSVSYQAAADDERPLFRRVQR